MIQFVYDGAVLIAEVDENGDLVAVYTHGAQGLISMRRGNASYFYHFDGVDLLIVLGCEGWCLGEIGGL